MDATDAKAVPFAPANFAKFSNDDDTRHVLVGAQLLQLVSDTRQRTYFAVQSMDPAVMYYRLKLKLAPGAATTRMVPDNEVLKFTATLAGRTGLNLREDAVVVPCGECRLEDSNELSFEFLGSHVAYVVGVEQDFAKDEGGAGVLLPAIHFHRPFMNLEVKCQFKSSINSLAILHGVNFTCDANAPNSLLTVQSIGHGVVVPVQLMYNKGDDDPNFKPCWWEPVCGRTPVFRCERHTGPLPANNFNFVRPLIRPEAPPPEEVAAAQPTPETPVDGDAAQPTPETDPLFTPVDGAAAQPTPPSVTPKPERPALADDDETLGQLAAMAARAFCLGVLHKCRNILRSSQQ